MYNSFNIFGKKIRDSIPWFFQWKINAEEEGVKVEEENFEINFRGKWVHNVETLDIKHSKMLDLSNSDQSLIP